MLSLLWRTLPALGSCAFSALQAKRLGAEVPRDERTWRTAALLFLFVSMLSEGSGAITVCVTGAGIYGLMFLDAARHPFLHGASWLLFVHSLRDILVALMAAPFAWAEWEHARRSPDVRMQMAVFFLQYMAFTCACVSVAAL